MDILETELQVGSAISRPLIGAGRKPAHRIFAKLDRNLGQSDSAVILGYCGPRYGHWTVVSHILVGRLMLMDSSNVKPLDCARFVYRDEVIEDIENAYHFSPTCVIEVRIAK